MGRWMRRRHDWPERLSECISAARHRRFEWGAHDCCLFAADAVRDMTGVDPASDYRGRYADKAGAFRILEEVAGGGVESAAFRAFGDPLDGPLFAQRGDVVLIETERGDALGVCVGAHVAFAGENGVAFVPLEQAVKAWRVG